MYHLLVHAILTSNGVVVFQVGEGACMHQHQLAHQCSPCEKFAHIKYEVKLTIGIWKWGIYDYWGGIYGLMGGAVMT